MSKEDVVEKAVPVCGRSQATVEEILKQCGVVCQITFQGKGNKGLMSCSHSSEGSYLNVCLWKPKENGKFESISRFELSEVGLIILKGFASEALKTVKST